MSRYPEAVDVAMARDFIDGTLANRYGAAPIVPVLAWGCTRGGRSALSGQRGGPASGSASSSA